MWITILIAILTNLPALIESARKAWDMIRNLRSRKERSARRVQMKNIVMKHCKNAKDPGAAEACRLELEDLYEKVAYKVQLQGPDMHTEGDPDAEDEL